METEDDEYDRERFRRQLPIIGEKGQEALRDASATIVGLGGLGSPAATYLALAGFGRLILVDRDRVAKSNFNRQFLHSDEDLHREKTESAREFLEKLNPGMALETIEARLSSQKIGDLPETDLILGAVDNFQTRYLLNEYALEEGIPYIHGAIEGLGGQLTTVIPGRTPCLACIFPERPSEKQSLPVLGTAAGVIGVLMANEAIKYVTEKGELVEGNLLLLDLSRNELETVAVQRDPHCPVCGQV